MKCPFCTKINNKVIDSRLSKDGRVIRRRRECLECARRFTTYERLEEMLPMVVKKDGRREAFDREKIVSGIRKACQKRPVESYRIEEFVEGLESYFQELGKMEIESSEIGEKVMNELRQWDEVAYVRFASVYRQFRDISEFMAELEDILKSKREQHPAIDSVPCRDEEKR